MNQPPDPENQGESLVERDDQATSLMTEIEREELERRLHAVRRKEKRHMLWLVLGISPAAIIPAIGLLLEGSMGLLLLLGLLVAVSQGYSWSRAAREAEELEARLGSIAGDLPAPDPENATE